MIRAVPANASDNVYCTVLAQSAIHGAMAGYTGYTVGPVNGRQCYIPFYVSIFHLNFNLKNTFQTGLLRFTELNLLKEQKFLINQAIS